MAVITQSTKTIGYFTSIKSNITSLNTGDFATNQVQNNTQILVNQMANKLNTQLTYSYCTVYQTSAVTFANGSIITWQTLLFDPYIVYQTTSGKLQLITESVHTIRGHFYVFVQSDETTIDLYYNGTLATTVFRSVTSGYCDFSVTFNGKPGQTLWLQGTNTGAFGTIIGPESGTDSTGFDSQIALEW